MLPESTQFDAYLVDRPHIEEAEAAGGEDAIADSEIWEAMKLFGRDKSPGLYGLLYEMLLRQSLMLFPLLTLIYNNWM